MAHKLALFLVACCVSGGSVVALEEPVAAVAEEALGPDPIKDF